MDEPLDLDAILARAQAVTQQELHLFAEAYDSQPVGWTLSTRPGRDGCHDWNHWATFASEADARFFDGARRDVPALVREVRRWRDADGGLVTEVQRTGVRFTPQGQAEPETFWTSYYQVR